MFDRTGVWIKNDNNPLFDVTVGSFDVTEVCEFVGLYLLSKIDLDNVGLYRDERLALMNNVNDPKLDRRKN